MYGDKPPRKKSRTGLVRSYAIAYLSDARPEAENNNDGSDGYEPDTEQEKVDPDTEQERATVLEDEEETPKENEETPKKNEETAKKKKKGDKPKVRDLIKARRDDLVAQEDMEVSYALWNRR
jgi:hypothetical protein